MGTPILKLECEPTVHCAGSGGYPPGAPHVEYHVLTWGRHVRPYGNIHGEDRAIQVIGIFWHILGGMTRINSEGP